MFEGQAAAAEFFSKRDACKACTCLVNGKAVTTCSMRVSDAKGKKVITIEGLANGNTLHPVQKAWLDIDVPQCGFCQPGQIMAAVSGGGMAAVIGMEPRRIQEVLSTTEAGRRLDVANFNSYDQTVIAGPKADLAVVKEQFEEAGVRAYIPLNVSAPFHSRYMREAQMTFAAFLHAVPLVPPQIPVISNVSGKPYEGDLVWQTLSEQIGNSVRWLESIVYLLDRTDPQFEEVGPGTVLTKLVAQIKKKRPSA